MKIPIAEFELHIDELILRRGLNYFKKGRVGPIYRSSPTEIAAEISGTQQYETTLKIEAETLLSNRCTCPYDQGPICKHAVALLFAHQASVLNLTLPAHKPHEPKKRPAIQKSIEAIPLLTRRRYYGWDDAKAIAGELFEILEMARRALEDKNYETAFSLTINVFDELMRAINHVDDSSGHLGDAMATAEEIFTSITTIALDEELRRAIYLEYLSRYDRRKYEGWPWHLTMLELAIKHSARKAEFKQLRTRVEEISDRKNCDDDYNFHRAQCLMFELIKRSENPADADDYLEANVDNDFLRKILIDRAIEAENFDRAILLAEQKIKKNRFDDQWNEYLLEIYCRQGNTHKIIEISRYFLISRGDCRPYYDLLKKHVARDEWKAFIAQAISEIRSDSSYYISNRFNIYIWEKQLFNALQVVKHARDLDLIKYAEKELAATYSAELADCYCETIIDYLDGRTGRKCYFTACRYIRRISKLNEDDKATALVEKLRQLHPTRRALHEELDRV